jgi:hypothetical protein
MVDNHDFDGSLGRRQLQPQLFLDNREERGAIRLSGRAGSRFQDDIEGPRNTGAARVAYRVWRGKSADPLSQG